MSGLRGKLKLIVLTSLFAGMLSAAPRAQELFWPHTLDGASGHVAPGQPGTSRSPAQTAQENAVSEPESPASAWDDLSGALDPAPRENPVFKPPALSTDPTNQFGATRLGLETEKHVRGTDPLRREQCPTDDDCADYSGLPKTEPGKRNLRTVRKPFIGLSITRPLQ